MLKVIEIIIKVYLLSDIPQNQIHNVIAEYIDSYFLNDVKYMEFHEKNIDKLYVFDSPVPLAEQGIYKADAVYQFRIRTVDSELADYFAGGLANHQSKRMKGLVRTIRIIPPKVIERVYSITPIIIKDPEGKGYWRDCMTFEEFEKAIKSNLIRKYNVYTGEKVSEDIQLYNQIELLSKGAIGIPYKGITLLGDKISIMVSENEQAQKLWYFALGAGVCEMNARGCGFLQYKFM